jgi:sulfoxide reductase heme-binding subunit YedZ
VLLSLSVALWVAQVRRMTVMGAPRFVLEAVHRTGALLAVAFVLVHVVTTVLDPYAGIAVVAAVIPFSASYRPLWLGLGAVAFDLLLAVVVTSLARVRIGFANWRWVHWLAYASWPVALIHGFGTGSDAATHWMLGLTVACVVLVLAAALRLAANWPQHAAVRTSAGLLAAALPVGLIVWLPGGPLASGWARRAGTPVSLLHGAALTASRGAASPAAGSSTAFTAPLTGNVVLSALGGDRSAVDLALRVAGSSLSVLRIHLQGPRSDEGGLEMTSSRVSLGPASDPVKYAGTVTGLAGSSLSAQVRDAAGAAYALAVRLSLPPGDGAVSGVVSARPGG